MAASIHSRTLSEARHFIARRQSIRKLQSPFDRVEARLLANRIEERSRLYAFEIRVAQARLSTAML